MSTGWEEDAMCCVCIELFTEPVSLKCGHNICKGCAVQMVGAEAGDRVACPLCRKETPLPEGVEGLQCNTALKNIVDGLKAEKERLQTAMCGNCEEAPAAYDCETCGFPLCEACKTGQHGRGGYRKHKVFPLGCAARLRPKQCTQHHKDLDLYDEDTNTLMCIYCLQLGSKRAQYTNVVPLSDAVDKTRGRLAAALEKLDEKAAQLDDASGRLQLFRSKSGLAGDGEADGAPRPEDPLVKLEAEVRKEVASMRAVLDAREAILLGEIQEMREKNNASAARTAATLASLSSLITRAKTKFGDLLAEPAHSVDLLAARDMMLGRVNALCLTPCPSIPSADELVLERPKGGAEGMKQLVDAVRVVKPAASRGSAAGGSRASGDKRSRDSSSFADFRRPLYLAEDELPAAAAATHGRSAPTTPRQPPVKKQRASVPATEARAANGSKLSLRI